jgi:hypothetical protein
VLDAGENPSVAQRGEENRNGARTGVKVAHSVAAGGVKKKRGEPKLPSSEKRIGYWFKASPEIVWLRGVAMLLLLTINGR